MLSLGSLINAFIMFLAIEKHAREQGELVETLKAENIDQSLKIEDLTGKLENERKIRTRVETLMKEQNELLKTKSEDKSKERPGITTKMFSKFPETSIWCFGEDRHDRYPIIYYERGNAYWWMS